jgi:alpha-tubulin suppressor-like RCC1 family protein
MAQVIHIVKGDNVYFKLPCFYLDSSGIRVHTAGKDECFQLGHSESRQRFYAELEKSSRELQNPVFKTFKRPSPDAIDKNDDILFLTSNGTECYPEYPYWTDISTGDMHTLACTKDGRLYSWGTNLFGQLGHSLGDIKNHQLAIVNPPGKKVLCNPRDFDPSQSKLVTLNHTLEKSYHPYRPVMPFPYEIKTVAYVTAVACGLYHSLVLNERGQVYSFGLGEKGRLGHGLEENVLVPTIIEGLTGKYIVKIGAGYHTSFFLDDHGDLYSCGDYSKGALGQDSDTLIPKAIAFLKRVYQFSSSMNHTGVVTKEGQAILFGNNEFGKVGGSSPNIFHEVDNKPIRAVYCGGKHTCVLTHDLEVYSWGCNTKGQLGMSSTIFRSMEKPVRVEYLRGRGVCNMALGHEHSVAITIDGLLYTWGSNTKGQLAIGTLAKEFRRVGLPRLIDHLLGVPVTTIAASKYNTIFITTETHPEVTSSLFQSWKRSMLIEERIAQERANYRYILLIRELNRQILVDKIQQERDNEYGRAQSAGSQNRTARASKSSSQEYYRRFCNFTHSNASPRLQDLITPKNKKHSRKTSRSIRTSSQPRGIDMRSTINESTDSGSQIHIKLPNSGFEKDESLQGKHVIKFKYTSI